MADNKLNYILFVVLSIGIIFGFTYFFNPPPEKATAPGKKVSDAEIRTSNDVDTFPSEEIPDTDGIAGFDDVGTPAAEGTLITVETPLYIGVIDTAGGRITSWQLKKYKESTNGDGVLVDLFKNTPPGFDPLVKVKNIELPEFIPFDYNGSTDISLTEGRKSISMVWSSPEGIRITNTMEFDASTYLMKQTLDISNNTGGPVTERLYISWFGNVTHRGRGEDSNSFITLVSNDFEKVEEKPDEVIDYKGQINWFGYASKYFMATVLPEIGADTVLRITPAGPKDTIKSVFGYPSRNIASDKSISRTWEVYLGPLENNLLKPVGDNLDEAVNFGWFGFLAKPLLDFLKFLNKYFHNYGVSIIVITVLIRLLFLPLTIRSMASMRRMQLKMEKIKPEMDELKEKYKDDKAKQNSELMKLYSKHGVNPLSSLGGCLPMLIQIPVFIALYDVLLNSIDLRHSSFLWIQDLAAPETLFDIPVIGVPFRVLPLLMGVSWFLSQKMTPMTAAAGNENMALQMKMMQFMPIIFTVLFWSLPSGLILYWTVSNLLSIGQQLYVNRFVIIQKGGN